jgi:hypothetical protein
VRLFSGSNQVVSQRLYAVSKVRLVVADIVCLGIMCLELSIIAAPLSPPPERLRLSALGVIE